MRTVKDVDPQKQMGMDDFILLFHHLPLTEDELNRLKNEYFVMYTAFIGNGVEPVTAWLAIRNIFINKEQQIGERTKGDIIGVAGKTVE